MTAPYVRTPGANRANAEDQKRNQHVDSPTDTADLQAAELAQFERLRGTLEQRGIELHATVDGRYTVRRGKLSQVLNDLDAVERFARLIGGAV